MANCNAPRADKTIYSTSTTQAMSRIEDIPPELMNVSKEAEFKEWVLGLPVSLAMRRIYILDWCQVTGLVVSPELLKRFQVE
jgi:hypothetical protein